MACRTPPPLDGSIDFSGEHPTCVSPSGEWIWRASTNSTDAIAERPPLSPFPYPPTTRSPSLLVNPLLLIIHASLRYNQQLLLNTRSPPSDPDLLALVQLLQDITDAIFWEPVGWHDYQANLPEEVEWAAKHAAAEKEAAAAAARTAQEQKEAEEAAISVSRSGGRAIRRCTQGCSHGASEEGYQDAQGEVSALDEVKALFAKRELLEFLSAQLWKASLTLLSLSLTYFWLSLFPPSSPHLAAGEGGHWDEEDEDEDEDGLAPNTSSEQDGEYPHFTSEL